MCLHTALEAFPKILTKRFNTFRFLATGDSYISLALSYRVSPPAIGKIVPETCTVIWNILNITLIKRRTFSDFPMNDTTIYPHINVKYLGILIDRRLKFILSNQSNKKFSNQSELFQNLAHFCRLPLY